MVAVAAECFCVEEIGKLSCIYPNITTDNHYSSINITSSHILFSLTVSYIEDETLPHETRARYPL